MSADTPSGDTDEWLEPPFDVPESNTDRVVDVVEEHSGSKRVRRVLEFLDRGQPSGFDVPDDVDIPRVADVRQVMKRTRGRVLLLSRSPDSVALYRRDPDTGLFQVLTYGALEQRDGEDPNVDRADRDMVEERIGRWISRGSLDFVLEDDLGTDAFEEGA